MATGATKVKNQDGGHFFPKNVNFCHLYHSFSTNLCWNIIFFSEVHAWDVGNAK
jgi:hypothetical protein